MIIETQVSAKPNNVGHTLRLCANTPRIADLLRYLVPLAVSGGTVEV
jgi:hypothetical protein